DLATEPSAGRSRMAGGSPRGARAARARGRHARGGRQARRDRSGAEARRPAAALGHRELQVPDAGAPRRTEAARLARPRSCAGGVGSLSPWVTRVGSWIFTTAAVCGIGLTLADDVTPRSGSEADLGPNVAAVVGFYTLLLLSLIWGVDRTISAAWKAFRSRFG